MKKVLVTGGAGFIGSHLVDKLIEQGHEVTIFDNLEPQVHGTSGDIPAYVNEDARFIKGDVRDRDALLKALKNKEIVFHEAAMVGVGQSQYQIERYMSVNTMGTALLLDLIVNNNLKIEKLIVAASMSSYGEGAYVCPSCGPVSPELRSEEQMARGEWELRCPRCATVLEPIPTAESKPQHINSIYALSKKDQEDMVLNIGRTYQLSVAALRYFNVYGPRQSLSNPYTGVAAIFLSLIKNNKAPVIYEDGLQTRDFVSVYDIVQANLLAMEKREADYQVFNVGSGIGRTIKSIAENLLRITGKRNDLESNITYKYRKGDVRHCYADISKLKNALGYEPRVDFEQGMRELIAWSEHESAADKFDEAIKELRQRNLV